MKPRNRRARNSVEQAMCSLCGSPHVSELPGFCLSCTIEVRREFYEGLDRLYEYLAAWAAFQEWEAAHAIEAR